MPSITASEMGRRGARARIKNTTPTERSAIASKAAKARWKKARRKRKKSA